MRKKDRERVRRVGVRREGGRIQYHIPPVVPPIVNTTFSLKKGGGLYTSIHFKLVLTIHHHKPMDTANKDEFVVAIWKNSSLVPRPCSLSIVHWRLVCSLHLQETSTPTSPSLHSPSNTSYCEHILIPHTHVHTHTTSHTHTPHYHTYIPHHTHKRTLELGRYCILPY